MQWLGAQNSLIFNTLRPRQNGRHFPDDILKWIFLNENLWISITISLKFVPRGPINNIPTLVQVMAWRRPGDKPLSEPMMVRLPTHICVTRPQWVNYVRVCVWHLWLWLLSSFTPMWKYEIILTVSNLNTRCKMFFYQTIWHGQVPCSTNWSPSYKLSLT